MLFPQVGCSTQSAVESKHVSSHVRVPLMKELLYAEQLVLIPPKLVLSHCSPGSILLLPQSSKFSKHPEMSKRQSEVHPNTPPL